MNGEGAGVHMRKGVSGPGETEGVLGNSEEQLIDSARRVAPTSFLSMQQNASNL